MPTRTADPDSPRTARRPKLRTEPDGRRHGETDEGEEREEELRAPWTPERRALVYGDLGKITANRVRLAAERYAELQEYAGGPLRRFAGIEGGSTSSRLTRVENPLPNASLGYASPVVRVSSKRSLEGTVLRIRLDAAAAAELDPGSIRLFRFEPGHRCWVPIVHSGRHRNYAWGRATVPGSYVAIGAPSDPSLRSALTSLVALKPPWAHLGASERRRLLSDAAASLQTAAQREGTVDRRSITRSAARLRGLTPSSFGLPEARLLGLGPDLPCWSPVPMKHPPGPGPEPLPKHDMFWKSEGPTNVSGRILSLAIHPDDGDILFAGSVGGGIWKTTDGAATWEPVYSFGDCLAIQSLAIAPSNPKILYAGTGEIFAFGHELERWGIGVLRSQNGGKSWYELAPIASQSVMRIAIHPTEPDTLYVAGNKHLYKSTDGGTSWTILLTGHCSDVCLDPLDPKTVYVIQYKYAFQKSSDGGATWNLVQEVPCDAFAGWARMTVAARPKLGQGGKGGGRGGPGSLDPSSSEHLLLVKTAGLVYASRDGAKSWSQVPKARDFQFDEPFFNLVAVDPFNWDVIFYGSIILNKTRDGGKNWSGGDGGTHVDNHALVFDTNDSARCYAATDGGVSRSDDNGKYGTWVPMVSGLTTTQAYGIGVSQTAPFRIGIATQDVGFLLSQGKPNDWKVMTTRDARDLAEGGMFLIDPSNSLNMYASGHFAYPFRSTDGGASWEAIGTGLPLPESVLLDPFWQKLRMAVSPGDSKLLMCTLQGAEVFRSIDLGSTWESVFDAGNDALYNIVFAPSNPDVVYAHNLIIPTVYRSTKHGNPGTWTKLAPATPLPNGTIRCLAVSWSDENLLWLGYDDARIFRSTDAGATWQDASGARSGAAIPVNHCYALVPDLVNPENCFAATDIGVFRTYDAGFSWVQYGFGMPSMIIYDLALHRPTNTLYAATNGRGVYSFRVW